MITKHIEFSFKRKRKSLKLKTNKPLEAILVIFILSPYSYTMINVVMVQLVLDCYEQTFLAFLELVYFYCDILTQRIMVFALRSYELKLIVLTFTYHVHVTLFLILARF